MTIAPRLPFLFLLCVACHDGKTHERFHELEGRIASLEQQVESRGATSQTEAKIREELASLQRGRAEAAQALAKLEETLATAQRRQEELAKDAAVAARIAEPAQSASGFPTIGIAECDRFLASYATCIDEKMPQAAREATRDAMRTAAEIWKREADGPGRAAVADSCKQTAEAAKKAVQAFDCQF